MTLGWVIYFGFLDSRDCIDFILAKKLPERFGFARLGFWGLVG